MRECEVCSAPIAYLGRGRPRVYCSASCRLRAAARRRGVSTEVDRINARVKEMR